MASTSRSQRIIKVFLILSGVLAFIYAAGSIYLTIILAYRTPLPITRTPASLGLSYRSVTFPSRDDHLLLRGWFIPGILPNGQLTVERVVIQVHGSHNNRSSILDLSKALVRNGFAVLAFDMRGNGESAPAAFGGGYFEQRDVLGAVDYLRSGPLPYPGLGRPTSIGAWGISLGGDAVLFAAAQEPAIKALIVDSAFATMQSYSERAFGPAVMFIPGTRVVGKMLYGLDYLTVRPVDEVAKIAPRAILFIQGADDVDILPSNMFELASAASAAPGADVETWLVPNAHHIQAYYLERNTYVNRMVTFFTTKL
jgi:fermentation-respiration switch protein FrsA (DUF1100 family)